MVCTMLCKLLITFNIICDQIYNRVSVIHMLRFHFYHFKENKVVLKYNINMSMHLMNILRRSLISLGQRILMVVRESLLW